MRASVRTARNFSPARKVWSITLPSEARRSFVRTNAPPLPGLTCWNSRILKIVPVDLDVVAVLELVGADRQPAGLPSLTGPAKGRDPGSRAPPARTAHGPRARPAPDPSRGPPVGSRHGGAARDAAVPPGRPGWWRTAWSLVVGAGLGFCALLVPGRSSCWARGPASRPARRPARRLAVRARRARGPGRRPRVRGFVLALLTVVTRAALRAWLEDPPAPTWIAAGTRAGRVRPGPGRPAGRGGFWGLLVAVVVIRFGGFDAEAGRVPGRWPSCRRTRGGAGAGSSPGSWWRGWPGPAPTASAHPVAGASSSGSSGAPLVPGVDPPVRSGFVALEARGRGPSRCWACAPPGPRPG